MNNNIGYGVRLRSSEFSCHTVLTPLKKTGEEEKVSREKFT